MSMNFSEFYWFKKNKTLPMDVPVICKDNGRDQKVLFILKGFGKHLTFSISKRICEFHATDDDKRNDHRTIFWFPVRKMKRDAIKFRNSKKFIPFSDKFFTKMIIIDPRSLDYFKSTNKMSYMLSIPPLQILRLRISPKKMLRYHNKILSVYSKFCQFQGYVKIDARRHGAFFCSQEPVNLIRDKYVDLDFMRKRLVQEGLTENQRNVRFWKRWDSMVNWFNSIPHKGLA